MGGRKFKIRAKVTCDDVVVYDSGESLFRKALVFETAKEVKSGSCVEGDYYLVVPHGEQIDSMNVEVVPVSNNAVHDTYVVTLDEGFFLAVGEWTVFSDSESASSSKPSIQVNRSWPDVRFVDDVAERTIVQRGECLTVAFREGIEPANFEAVINGGVVPWERFDTRESGGNVFFSYPLNFIEGRNVDVLVRDLTLAKIVGIKQLRIVSKLTYRFNRKYYFSKDDYLESSLGYSIDDSIGSSPFLFEDRFASVLHDDGVYEFQIPKITIKDVVDMSWGSNYLEWAGNIAADRFLVATHPESCVLWLRVDNERIGEEAGGRFPIGSAVRAARDACRNDWFDVMLGVLDQEGTEPREYRIGRIAARETFTDDPSVFIRGRTLVWNQGGKFVGSPGTTLIFVIRRDGFDVAALPLDPSSEVIALETSFEDGAYEFEIVKEPDNPFLVVEEVLARGTFFVGDKEAYRFVGSRIVIDATTFEDGVEDAGPRRIELKEVFVDGISYHGTEIFEGIERAVYFGTMYYVDSSGTKVYYSDSTRTFTRKKGPVEIVKHFSALNPVKIICLSDMALCLTDSEGDVPYCERRARDAIYSITALEDPDEHPGDPDGIIVPDLFSYRKEAI